MYVLARIHPRENLSITHRLQALPTNFTLDSCTSDSPTLGLPGSSFAYEFECNEDTPSVCSLIGRPSSGRSFYVSFPRVNAEFTSIIEKEMTLKVYGSTSMEWSVTCYFSTVTLAQQFYKRITRDRRSEWVNACTYAFPSTSN